MNQIKYLTAILLASAMALTAANVAAAPAVKPTKAEAAKAAAAANQRVVEYQELEKHVGAKITIETTNNTTRSGTLLRYTNVAVSMQLGPEAGAIELSVPRNSVRQVSVTVAAADPLFPNDTFKQEAAAGAKKN